MSPPGRPRPLTWAGGPRLTRMTESTPGSGPPAQLRKVLHPVADVGAAAEFYGAAFGLPVKVVDGDRYAALDAGGVSLALAGPAEDVTGGVAAASFKVADVT